MLLLQAVTLVLLLVAKASKEPFDLISPSLVGLFEFNSKTIHNSAIETSQSTKALIEDSSNDELLLSVDAIQGSSLYFDGFASVEVPLRIDGDAFPRITVGAWIKFAYKEQVSQNIR